MATHKIDTFSLVAVIVYSSLQVIIMLLRKQVSDEDWFIDVAEGVADTMAVSGIVTTVAIEPNLFGYGSIYWLIFGFVAHYTSATFLVMRGLAWLAVTLIPLAIVVRGLVLKSRYTPFALALWLIMPVAWWDGKLIGPDLYVVAIAAVGLMCLLMQRWRGLVFVGGVLLGVALGIKLNVLSVVVYGTIVTLLVTPTWWQRLRYSIEIASATLLGFILANLSILRGFMPWYDVLKEYTVPGQYSWAAVHYTLLNPHITWDKIHVGGLFQVSLNLFSFVGFILLCVLAKVPKKHLLAGSVALGVAIISFISNGIFYGWYWFPTLLILPFMLLEAQRFTKKLAILAVVVIVVAAITALPWIYTGYKNQPIHYPPIMHS